MIVKVTEAEPFGMSSTVIVFRGQTEGQGLDYLGREATIIRPVRFRVDSDTAAPIIKALVVGVTPWVEVEDWQILGRF